MIIDATNHIAGRIASLAAKSALLGESVEIINCEKAYITGSRENVLAKYKRKRAMGAPATGPFFPRQSHMMLKRIIRGMLPYKTDRGLKAFKRIKCHHGVPESLKNKKPNALSLEGIAKVPNLRMISIGEISGQLGAKQ